MAISERAKDIYYRALVGFNANGWQRSVSTQDRGMPECKYRTNDPKVCCAIGFSIPDDRYDRCIEGKPIPWFRLGYTKEPGLRSDDYRFLSELQETHDLASSSQHLRRGILRLGKDYGL